MSHMPSNPEELPYGVLEALESRLNRYRGIVPDMFLQPALDERSDQKSPLMSFLVMIEGQWLLVTG